MNQRDLVDALVGEMWNEEAHRLCGADMFGRELVRRLNLETRDQIFVPGTPKPEINYLRAERFSKEHAIPVPMMFVKVEATNPDGSPGEIYEDRSRTFNRNYWNWVFRTFGGIYAGNVALSSDTTFGAGHLPLKQTNGTVVNANGNERDPQTVWNPGTTASTGIVVGTGTAAESFEDSALGAIVAAGSGAGQLNYVAMTITGNQPTYNSGTKVWTATITRIMNNNSGGTIVIGETALYANGNVATGVMICRDKLAATVSVLNAGQLTVTYTITLTFPA